MRMNGRKPYVYEKFIFFIPFLCVLCLCCFRDLQHMYIQSLCLEYINSKLFCVHKKINFVSIELPIYHIRLPYILQKLKIENLLIFSNVLYAYLFRTYFLNIFQPIFINQKYVQHIRRKHFSREDIIIFRSTGF